MATTIILEEKQLKRLMDDKKKYRKPYYKIIEGYQKLITKLSLHQELDMIMGSMITEKKTRIRGKKNKDKKDKNDTSKQP